MRVLPVPCLEDNYAYLLMQDGEDRAVVVDPSEAEPVARALERAGLRLIGILNTHHHPDHVGGNEELVARFGKMPVYAHESDYGRVPGQTERVEEGRPVHIGGLTFDPLHVPGHTRGAVTYAGEGAVFTGDTLFVAGCGRLFEGTPEQMYRSLCEKLAALPPETRIYCGHEYTASNLRFAAAVEPENAAVKEKIARVRLTRERGEPTVPSTLAEELATNPFLRVTEPGVLAWYAANGGADGASAVEVLARVRKAKDAFR